MTDTQEIVKQLIDIKDGIWWVLYFLVNIWFVLVLIMSGDKS